MTHAGMQGDGLLRLAASDNVLVATRANELGTATINGGGHIELRQPVTLGHKVAARDIAAGEAIIKYGVSIGFATEAIGVGCHVHIHNMKSGYTPTHTYEASAAGEQ